MTAQDQLDDVRADHPEWLVWRLGPRWWAKQRNSEVSARATDLDALLLRMDELQADGDLCNPGLDS